MTKKFNFQIDIADDAMEDKNKALGTIIRKARASIAKTDIPGQLTEFGDETPMSTIDIRKLFGLEKANFSHHFISFKKHIDKNYNRTITPLIEGNNGPDIYTMGVVRDFLAYMNRDDIKYEITL